MRVDHDEKAIRLKKGISNAIKEGGKGDRSEGGGWEHGRIGESL